MLTFLSLPPVSWWWCGLVAPLPVVVVGWATPRPWLGGLGVAIGSLPLWIYHHAWIADVSFAGVFPLVGYLAVWIGLAVVVLARLRKVSGWVGPAVVVPTGWVGLEFIRGELAFGGYPWFMAGHPMIESVTVSRAASVGGVYLISWLVVALSGVLLAKRVGGPRPRRVGLGVSGLLVALLILSVVLPRSGGSGERLRVGALQTNVPQSNKITPTREQLVADFRTLVSLGEEAVAGGAELLVTPETVLPGGLLDPDARAVIPEPYGEALLAEQGRLGVPMLVGCTNLGGVRVEGERVVWDDTYNSVFLLADGGVRGPRYDKLRPTPFGETLPYVQSLPWLRDWVLQVGLGASGMDFGLTPGRDPVSFSVPNGDREVVVTVPICFESSMAPTVRRLVNAARASGRPSELLCVVTNDGWFGSFNAGRSMHLLQARWRCIEHGLPMVRCANTGVSALIDRRGRVTASLGPGQPGALIAETELGGRPTAYQSVGDTVGWVCAGATLFGLVLTIRRPAKHTSETQSEAQGDRG